MRKLSVTTKLSMMYATLGVTLMLLLTFAFYRYNKENIYKENINNLQQISESIMIKIDSRLANIDQVAIELLGNNEFITQWETKTSNYHRKNTYIESSIKKALVQSYMNKPDIRRVAVFDEDGYYICTGRSNVSRHELLERIKKTTDIAKMNYKNSRVFLSPHDDFWDSNSRGRVISEIKPIKNREKRLLAT